MIASESKTVRSSPSVTRPMSCGGRWSRCSKWSSRVRASSWILTISTNCQHSWLNSCRRKSSCTKCSCSGRTTVWIVSRIITGRWLLDRETIRSNCSKGFQSNSSIKYFHIDPNSQITRITSWTSTLSTICTTRPLSQFCRTQQATKPSRPTISTTTTCLTTEHTAPCNNSRNPIWNSQYYITLTNRHLLHPCKRPGLSRYHWHGCPHSSQVLTHIRGSITIRQLIKRGKKIMSRCRLTIRIYKSNSIKCQTIHSRH